jgi:hypothetical protein
MFEYLMKTIAVHRWMLQSVSVAICVAVVE